MGSDEELLTLKVVLSRFEILQQIDQGIREKRAIRENVESSRTTVDRSIRELEDANVLRRRKGQCEFTRYGRIIYKEFKSVIEICKQLRAAPQLLSTLPPDAPIGPTIADATEVAVAPERAPTMLFERLKTPSECEAIRVSLPILFSEQIDLILKQLQEDTTLELIVHPELVDVLKKNFSEILAHLETNSTPIYITDDYPAFGITIFDPAEVRVSIYRKTGGLYGVLRNENPEAIRKSLSIFERQKQNSNTVTPAEFRSEDL